MMCANGEGFDQTAWICRLVLFFAVCMCMKNLCHVMAQMLSILSSKVHIICNS